MVAFIRSSWPHFSIDHVYLEREIESKTFACRYFITCATNRLPLAPQFVKPYVKSNKTDRNDAKKGVESWDKIEILYDAIR